MSLCFESENEIIEYIGENYLQKQERDLSHEYELLGSYNEKRFEDIPLNVEFVDEDPYSDAGELFNAIDDGELKIYSGGSSPDGMSDMQNLKGRAVHDYFGHYMNECDFSLEGEFNKWFNQKRDVPDDVERLLFSEVVGQTCLVHYLEDGFEDPGFEQRSVLFSDEVVNAVVDFYKPL